VAAIQKPLPRQILRSLDKYATKVTFPSHSQTSATRSTKVLSHTDLRGRYTIFI